MPWRLPLQTSVRAASFNRHAAQREAEQRWFTGEDVVCQMIKTPASWSDLKMSTSGSVNAAQRVHEEEEGVFPFPLISCQINEKAIKASQNTKTRRLHRR